MTLEENQPLKPREPPEGLSEWKSESASGLVGCFTLKVKGLRSVVDDAVDSYCCIVDGAKMYVH